ncbi:dihydrolipoyllysine-residue acetyltransferase component 4 of pyruvate dehydrogenase complex, chloroplastic-like [Olea europaea var. sylvestris]|uniref:dihydrolipoyllysine-residue acetyltransferase component 4 of pyruvate dehydrogenase complex, chloroplastic-like n=1 Tax=Olea europaea var. sylvestris TaxID=158386 RepID=UPI000C1D2B81|nr:dihydrolipoyllysine-residue acetyltransferase component 4 of pyruvate dehydrogenase complex, chloroplastic-like [Olea europaea var. sylvestris]
MASLLQSRTPSLSFSSSLCSTPVIRPSVSFLKPRSGSRIPVVRAKIREIFMPALSSTMTEGKIVSWIKSEGDVLSKGESVVVVESDKADMDVETFYDGILAAIVINEGETAPVGAAIGILAETEGEIAEAKAKATSQFSSAPAPSAPKVEESSPAPKVDAPSPPVDAAPAPSTPGKVVATPYAKKLAKQYKVDIGKLVGTGPFGRITPEDVEKAAGITPAPKSNVDAPAAPVASSAPASVPSKAPSNFPEIPGPADSVRASSSQIEFIAA